MRRERPQWHDERRRRVRAARRPAGEREHLRRHRPARAGRRDAARTLRPHGRSVRARHADPHRPSGCIRLGGVRRTCARRRGTRRGDTLSADPRSTHRAHLRRRPRGAQRRDRQGRRRDRAACRHTDRALRQDRHAHARPAGARARRQLRRRTGRRAVATGRHGRAILGPRDGGGHCARRLQAWPTARRAVEYDRVARRRCGRGGGRTPDRGRRPRLSPQARLPGAGGRRARAGERGARPRGHRRHGCRHARAGRSRTPRRRHAGDTATQRRRAPRGDGVGRPAGSDRGNRRAARCRRRVRRPVPAGQARRHPVASRTSRAAARGHGRRRHQRCAGARARRCGHRDGIPGARPCPRRRPTP